MDPRNWFDNVKGVFDFIDFPSPREFLMEYLLNLMLNPKTPQIVRDEYLELADFLTDLAIGILPIYGVVAVSMGLWKGELSLRLTQWFQAVVVVIVMVPVLPALIVGGKTFVDLLARVVFIRMLGDNPEQALRELFDLSGERGLDLILSIIQILGMIGLCLGLMATAVALVASVFVLIVGFVFRFLGDAGEAIFHTSIKITLYGVTGNGAALVALGVVVFMGQLISDEGETSRGIINTLAWLAAGYASWFMLKRTAGSIKSTAASVADGARRIKGGKSSDDSAGYDPNGGKKQTDEEAATHRKHTRARGRGKSSDKSISTEGDETEKAGHGRGKKASKEGQDEEGSEPNRHGREGRRSSSTKSRLLRHNNDDQKSKDSSDKSSQEQESDGDTDRRGAQARYRRGDTEREHGSKSAEESHSDDQPREDRPSTHRTPKEERQHNKDSDQPTTHERRRS